VERAKCALRFLSPDPRVAARYPSDMAVARQSKADQSVIKGLLNFNERVGPKPPHSIH